MRMMIGAALAGMMAVTAMPALADNDREQTLRQFHPTAVKMVDVKRATAEQTAQEAVSGVAKLLDTKGGLASERRDLRSDR